MERSPIQAEDDPSLRADFIAQEGLDEYLQRAYPELSTPEGLLASATNVVNRLHTDDTPEQIAAEMMERVTIEWAATLHPGTTFNEFLYLRGVIEIGVRAALIRQWNQQHEGTRKKVPEITA